MRPQTSQTPKPLFKQIVQNLPIPSSSQKVTVLPWHPLNQPSGHPQSERPGHLASQHFYLFRHLLVQPDTHSPNWTVIHKLLVILLPTSDTHPSTQTHTHPSRHTIMHTQTHTCIFLGTCWPFHHGNGRPSTRTPTNLLRYILRSADCFSFQGYDEKDGQADEAW